jgi:hypothetical protein
MWEMSKIGFVVVLGALLSVSGFGQVKKKAPATVSCPICKMALSAKKTAANPVAIRLKKGGPVMYCCPKCTMPATMLVKPKSKKA